MQHIQQYHYELLDGNIHSFNVQPSKEVIDKYFAIMQEIADAHPSDETLRILFTVRNADRFPVAYLMKHAGGFWAKYRNTVSIRAAYVHDSKIMFALYEQFVSGLRLNSHRRFFALDQRNEAITWLLEA